MAPYNATEEKFCNWCNQSHPKTPEFWVRNKSRKDGLARACKAKQAARRAEIRRIHFEEDRDPFDGTYKYCHHCQIRHPKTRDWWMLDRSRSSGLSSHCKVKQALYARKSLLKRYPNATKGPAKQQAPVTADETKRGCPACQQVLPKDAFTADRRRKDNLSSYCKTCTRHKSRIREFGPEYTALARRADGVCEYCGDPFREDSRALAMVIHHDHETGKLIAAIHSRCNLLEGLAKKMGQDAFRALCKAIERDTFKVIVGLEPLQED